MHKDAAKDVLEAADRWARAFHQAAAWKNDRNAVCVIWLEVDRTWMPFPDIEAYSIYSHFGGAIVRATSPAQLDVALKDLRSRCRIVNGRTFLPLGALTNLPSMK